MAKLTILAEGGHVPVDLESSEAGVILHVVEQSEIACLSWVETYLLQTMLIALRAQREPASNWLGSEQRCGC